MGGGLAEDWGLAGDFHLWKAEKMYNNTRERNSRKYEEKSELKVSLVIYGQPGGQNVFFFLSEVNEGSIINC